MVFIQYSKEFIKNAVGGCGEVIVLADVESTNTYVKEKCAYGISDRTLVITGHQTAGRGRQGKTFFSPQGGLYMSIAFASESVNSNIQLLTVYASLAVVRALNDVCGISAGIKWVNDIFFEGKKICGILCETVTDSSTLKISHYIVGIGVNIGTQHFPEELKSIAGNVACSDCNLLAASIAHHLFCILDSGYASKLMDEYRSKMFLMNHEVKFTINSKHYSGIVRDVNDNGNLMIQCDNETITLSSGEISFESKNYTN